MDKSRLRAVLWSEFKAGRTASATAQFINETHGKGTLSYATAKRWFQRFRSGDETLQEKRRPGRPKTVFEDLLKQRTEEAPRITIRELAKDLNCSAGSVAKHLKSMGYVKKGEQWVAQNLTDQKKKKKSVSKSEAKKA
ncbi:unnamed protein product [Bursaphelenchus okinawaensis]|uniref:Mos1 transposase HTH domain-containing protein n=1 Tax=Bursaphelenchus okinawaensis TaxID=465554 RepID=A0A811LL94_9BILA|nr:unnamed protein product [Bursaphelenchus okinawaensis]CAG9125194.1 unnamed protein product [Bursaphelenchus okinawaensis]